MHNMTSLLTTESRDHIYFR